MPQAAYAIGDLARLTGLSVRTIRYYLSQGLLPSPGEAGPGAHYGEGHLNRLRLTKRLQEQHLPLAEIRSRLGQLSDRDVSEIVADAQPTTPATSALEYIRDVLGQRSPVPAERPRASLLRRLESAPPEADLVAPGSHAQARAQPTAGAGPQPALNLAEQLPGDPPPLERSHWERLSLGPDIELHVRRPLSRLQQKRVERLITIARQVLKEDTP
jgi:DNA-binding transcriptional MerR regulator